MKKLILLLTLQMMLLALTVSKSEAAIQDETRSSDLLQLSQTIRAKSIADKAAAIEWANANGYPVKATLSTGVVVELIRIEDGRPIYYQTLNRDAAETIHTDVLWTSGDEGYGLSGSGVTVGMWDEANVRASHREFGGRAEQGSDETPNTETSSHATHVAGTIIASGVTSRAHGMAYNATLRFFDWNDDEAEAASEAADGLLISNHSYGNITGWKWNFRDDNRWTWWGDPNVSSTEDFRFGFYSRSSQLWDEIAFDAPYYLVVVAAGNDRSDVGPDVGTEYWILTGYDEDGGPTFELSTDARNGDGPYDCIEGKALAKNVLTVGAINDIRDGYSAPTDAEMSTFSSWGPSDDGRVKPDIVANGVELYSSDDDADDDYATKSGTSMAAPSVTGSLALIQERYSGSNSGENLHAAELKALVIHTAGEAGSNPGPDFQFGWGVMNTQAAINMVDQDARHHESIRYFTLDDGETFDLDVEVLGISPVRATIVWQDPPGVPVASALDPTDAMLVNDLDLRIEETESSNQYFPWRVEFDGDNEVADAGDNIVDNVERVDILHPSPGNYSVSVSHKGSLDGGSQNLAMILSGVKLADVAILTPADGEPVISRMTPHFWGLWTTVETVEITVSVADLSGDIISGLSPRDFSVLINGSEVASINGVVQTGSACTINIDPNVEPEGLYDLEVRYLGPYDDVVGRAVRVGGVLYTNQPLVERGLRWLRERQTASGYWNGPSGYSDRCGVTGLALQAFLAAGCSPDDDEDVRRGIQYLLDRQQSNGGIYYNGYRSGYKTAMALTALKSAAKYNPSNVAQIESAITAAENFYVIRQHPTYGGWRYEPQNGYDYDLSVSQWPILALKGVDNAALWDRVRRLLHTYCRHSSGGYKYQYNSGVTATMTCAGIWGEVIAGGPQSNIDAAFQWLENQYGSATGIVNAYDRAQRYYYLYSLAKACALAGKTRLAGENWFEILTDRLDATQQLNFWHTQGYWHNSYVSWENDEMSTALALLSLQVGTVPPDSRMRVYFVNNGPPKDNSASRYSQASASTMPSEIQGLYISIFDMDGNYAGPDENGNWITTIPGSQWISTGDVMEFDVPLERASTFSGEIHNNQNESALYTLRFEVYQGDNPDPVDEEEFEGQILPYQVLGTNASVNAIGGLSVYVSPLEIFPQMWLLPDLVEFTPLVNDTVYEFSFYVKETGGAANLNNIDVFVSSDLQDEEGNILSRHWFAFSPSHVDAVQAGDSLLISGTLTIPGADEFDVESVGTFEGLITVESTRQSRAIQVRASAGKGVLEGSILANNGQGVNGVRIDLYDTSGRLRVSGTTEREGIYYISGIPFGTYSVVMTTPLGYRTDEESMVRTIGREPTTANFTVTALNNVPSQRTLGYWAGQVNAAVLGAPRDYTPDQLSDLAGLISNHFNNHLMNPVKAYMVEGPADAEDSLNTLGLVLATGAVTVNEPILQRTARKQLVALLLNVVSGKLDQNTVCTEDGHPVSDVITYANMLISQPDSVLPPVPEWYTHSQLPWGQYEIAAHLAECVNSGLMLASHTIPMDILEVAYRLNEETVLPEHFFLSQNYPNPFNPTTDIDFYLPDATHVTLTVYNTLGQEVCVLLDRFMPAGLHTVTWRGIDHQGSKVATGIYLYRIVAGENESTRKMILVK